MRLDLLDNGLARRLLRSRLLPLGLQVGALVGLVLLVLNGWAVGQEVGADELKTLRKLNLTTLAVWGLWWPSLVAATLLFGRVWCSVCPAELVHRCTRALRQRLPGPTWPLPRWMRQGWLLLGGYLLLQLAVAGLSMHRVPHLTAVALVALCTVAVFAGLLFKEPRAFCQGLCPAAPLLSTYGRLAPLQLGIREPELCQGCRGRPCAASSRRELLDGRSCPSLLRPWRHQPGDGCVLCFQCAKACSQDNVGWGLHQSSGHAPLRPGETGFLLVVSGFVLHELATEAAVVEEVFHVVPQVVTEAVSGAGASWVHAAWFLLVVPLALWSLGLVVCRISGRREGVGELLRGMALGALPVVAATHAAKAVAKVGAWGPWLPLAMGEPSGEAGYRLHLAGELVAPARLYPASWVVLPILLLGGALLWRWHRGGAGPGRRVGLVLSGLVLGTALIGWIEPLVRPVIAGWIMLG